MQITYLGHGALSVSFNGKMLLVDPFFTGNPLTPNVDLMAVKADYLLLTHAHGDHVADAEAIARNTGALIIANYEVAMYYGARGLTAHGMNHGGKFAFDFGMVKYVTAVHSSVFPDGSYGGNPGGFVIWHGDECLYIAGDTALTMDMKLIPMTCPPLTVAVLPIGDNFTMGYEDATIASQFIECDTIIGYHYDTFPPITIDKSAAVKHFATTDKELYLPTIGETLTF